jgi:uncharacterized integral membrane protein
MHEHADSANDIGSSPKIGGRSEGVSPTLIVFLVLAVAAVIFVVQNSAKTQVRFLFFTLTTRVWAGVLVALVLGAVLDRLFTMWWRRRKERG